MKTTGSRASAVSQTRGFGDLLYDKAGARPSLDLDFAGTSSLRDKITGEYLVDHTRASGGTYIDNEGLVKEAQINYITNHKALSSGAGSETIVNPEGVEESIGFIAASQISSSNHKNHRFSGYSFGSGGDTTYAFSLYMRTDQGTASIQMDTNDNAIQVVTVTDQWQRFSVVETSIASNPYRFADLLQSDGSGNYGFNTWGGGASKVYVWGAQLEKHQVTDLMKTSGTINSAPRFTHDRVETGNLLHGTNRYLTDWSISSTSSLEPYAALAPDGTYSALKYVNNTGSYNTIYRHENYVSGVKNGKTYTLSAYVKTTGNSSHFKLWAFYGGTYLSDTGQTATPTDWTRYEVTFTATADKVRIGFDNSGGSWNTEFLFWGVQLNEGSSADTYVSSIDTFTSRLSNATFVDSAGLLKTSAVNKIHHSNFITSWARDSGLSPSNHRNDVVNPFGETEVQKVLELSMSNTSGQSVWYQTGVGKATGVLSVYAKANTFNNLNFGGQTPNQTISFNLTNGTINSTAGTTGAIENVGNGWYRCSVNVHTQTDWLIFQPHQDGATRVGARMQIVGPGSIFIYGAMFESPASQPSDFVENLTASTASFPRYSHDPETLTPTGLYLEPAVTNLAAHSNNFNTWTKHTTTTVTNANTETLSPDGLYNAWKLTKPANQNYPSIYKTHSTNNLNPHTFSLFAKAGTLDKLGLEIRGTGTVPQAFFDLTNGTVQSGTGQIKKYPNGWYRCSVTITTDSSEVLIIRGGDGPNQPGTIYIFGVQLEVGRFASSYIPTHTSTVTKAADVYTTTANLTETFEPRGLLIEEARTNLATKSHTPHGADWTRFNLGAPVASQITPMGTTENVAQMTEDSSTNNHYKYHNTVSSASSSATCLSIFAKPLGTNRDLMVRLIGIGGGGPFAVFDLNAGVVTGNAGTSGSSANAGSWTMGAPLIEKYANGWYRIGLTNVASGGSYKFGLYIMPKGATSENLSNFTGNGQASFAIYGPQYELGAFPTSYIHNTTSSSLTRSADVVTISGDNFGTYRTNKVFSTGRYTYPVGSEWQVTSSMDISLIVTRNTHANPIDGKFNAATLDVGLNQNPNKLKFVGLGNINPRAHTFSVYVKAISNPCRVQLYTNQVNNGRANFNLITGNAESVDGASTIEAVGNGWYRVSWSPDVGSTSGVSSINICGSISAGNSTRNQAGGANKFYFYGFQVESGSLTNFIPSTDTFVSRLSSATYFDSNGLIKTTPVNLFRYSQPTTRAHFNDYGTNAHINGNYAVAPDGTRTAARLTMSNAGFTYMRMLVPVEAGKTYTYSVYVKSNSATLNETMPQVASAGLAESVELVTLTDEWVRYTRTFTPTTTGNAKIGFDNGPRAIDHLVWGFQVEEGNTATEYINTQSAGAAVGAARYNHDPETLIPTGLYLEPASTNFVKQNTTLQLAGWSLAATAVSIDNTITNPDGSTGAAKISVTRTDIGQAYVAAPNQSASPSSADVVSFSGYFKYANHQYVDVYGNYNTWMVASSKIRLDLINGTVTTNNGYSATLTSLPNGWFYLRAHGPRPTSSSNHSPMFIWFVDDLNAAVVPNIAPGSKELYVWGLQTELTSRPTSTIINNTNSTVTRAADTYTSTATTVFDRDGGNKQSLWSPTANTMFGQMKYNEQTLYPRLYEFTSPNGESSTIFIDHNNGAMNGRMTTQAALQYNLGAGSATDNTLVKLASTYQLNDANIVIDGAVHPNGDDTVALHVLPTDSKRPLLVNIGDNGSGLRYANAPIQRITHWKTRLPNSSLINITT